MKSPKASPTLVMNEKVNAMWADGKDVLHLGFGESRFPVHPALSQMFQENASQRSYLSSLGVPELRDTIAKYYSEKLGINFIDKQIIVGVGSKSLLYAMIQSIEGDLLLPKPSWVSYSSIAHLTGKTIHRFLLDDKNDYSLNIQALDKAYQDFISDGGNPTMLVLNTPSNPVGNVSSDDEMKSVANWAQDKNIFILSDEIYSLVTHEGFSHKTIAKYYPEKTIIFGGLSKHLSLGGWRFGMAILPNNEHGNYLSKSFQSIAGSIWSCVPGPIQYTAILAYSGNQDIDAYIKMCTHIHELRTNYVHRKLKEIGLDSPSPSGAFYLYPSFKKWKDKLEKMNIFSCQNLSEYLLDDFGIATLPGSAFGSDLNNFCLRLSTSFLDMETDEQAKNIIDAYSDDFDNFIENHHPRTALFLEKMSQFMALLNE
ncbi:MAG: aminotransferase class I/II-fold pyridoxal phosphate-dependent enzyme [Candidatus Marinimicrobia bacterium]|jgi:aspartate/methionine/tyrosine aminotransferase|nr:aminotransferase class I/II-fold pyridoxal phosphate-dependent enzyme [Candidatus Neomarinimicrobiota bacterium]MBT3937979.1 aminotransferase class I/II-fold pyridoxal phosphate-dependent enzyme [Candidatus Neomarinimicrobiota bacterium]MBT4383810.1 aminotransferase class I/II-fold pyridoxal phosphate-dependent enzyme [Candidatus Neomarinimicrobiota bacterium]MBT4636898.1 aminotransferase class I/II-fold pyridoxal phosphate-dependent enzyme [Candidatus Neomarinimicrobiota bacterium]MBT468448